MNSLFSAPFAFTADHFGLVYLMAALLFVYGLKGLSSPKTARAGNVSAMIGMAIAIGITFFHPEVQSSTYALLGLLLGALIGMGLALKIQMTAMPQLVAILHSFVGLSAVCVAWGTFLNAGDSLHHKITVFTQIELAVGIWIGAVTFTGSLVAFGKLQEWLGSNPLVFRGQHFLNAVIALSLLGLVLAFIVEQNPLFLLLLTGLSLLLGFLIVLPIGGADMPVVVSMLNSYSGWAASATGFILNHPLLIMTGAFVGSSGAILSYIMCQAMNRSLLSVIFGGSSSFAGAISPGSAVQKSYRSAGVEDVAFLLENATQVIVVPGYGMAVAQAQHPMKELYHLLKQRGIQIRFAIHPVAGRMPGHMNVLLAESDIPYDCVLEMEEMNHEFSATDVVLVVGANDVVNPAAEKDKSSPLYGMPILEAYKAKQIFVIKRSMKAGYAGVDNDLFYESNCALVFGDAKKVIEGLVGSLKSS